jgi:hypothetical protein
MDPEQAAKLIESLEGEVNSGGFDQFFFNAAGDDTAETIRALDVIGAATTAEIVRRAVEKFPGGMPPKDRAARQDVLLQISPDAGAFKDLDGEFYQYSDGLSGLVAEYRSIRPKQRP